MKSFIKNKQINPLTLKLPSGKVLKGDELNRFSKALQNYFSKSFK